VRFARNWQPSEGLIQALDFFGGDMGTTDKSILEKISARMKEIIGIAEEAANRAMKAEKPPKPKKRVNDMTES